MVDCIAFEFGGGIVTGAAIIFAEEVGFEVEAFLSTFPFN